MKDFLWKTFAWFVSRPIIANWIIERAKKTPYSDLPGYMKRDWLFNGYSKVDGVEVTPIAWLPSIRVHHILRRDNNRHKHDHPWDARSIILKNGYTEQRLMSMFVASVPKNGRVLIRDFEYLDGCALMTVEFRRKAGDTATLNFGEFHCITEVPDEGVWTMFITFKYQGTWGFLVDGKKVPWREYMAMYPEKPWASDERKNA